MTTTVVERATVGASPIAVVGQLVRFEARRLISSWLVRLGLLGSIGLSVFETIDELPVLDRASVTLAWGLAPLMAAVVLIAAVSALRAVDPEREELTAASPASQGSRLAGISVGLAAPAILGLGVELVLLAWLLTRDPASAPVWPELLIGPAAVAAYGALAIAATRFVRHAATGPILLVAIPASIIALPYYPPDWGQRRGTEWLSVLPPSQDLIPGELAFRPSWVHLAYVIAVGTVFVTLSVVRFRARDLAVLFIGVGIAAGLGVSQMGVILPAEREAARARLIGPNADLTCEEHRGVTYCALPGYEGWIDNWAALVDPLAAALPDGSPTLEVRQYPAHYVFDFDQAAFSNWWWMKPAADDYRTRSYTIAVPARWADFDEPYFGYRVGLVALKCGIQCGGESQQAMVAWLSAQSEVGLAYLQDLSESPYVSYCLALDVLAQPDVLVPVLHANWRLVTDPGTTYDDLGHLLGVTVPPGADENGRLPGRCP